MKMLPRSRHEANDLLQASINWMAHYIYDKLVVNYKLKTDLDTFLFILNMFALKPNHILDSFLQWSYVYII